MSGQRLLTISSKENNNLAKRYKQMLFMREVVRSSTLTINGTPQRLGDLSNGMPGHWDEEIDVLAALAGMIEHFGGDPAVVDLDSLKPEQMSLLGKAVDATRNDGFISLKVERVSLLEIPCGDKYLLMIIVPEGERSRLYSAFDQSLKLMFGYQPAEGSDRIRISNLELVREDQLENVLNFPVRPSRYYENNLYLDENKVNLANWMCLNLVKAADRSASHQKKLLAGALDICDWLLEVESGALYHA